MPENDGGKTPLTGAVDPDIVAQVTEQYNYTPLSEVQKERDNLHKKLSKVFNEAGDDIDMQKVEEISGTPKEKAAKIVELNSRLTGLEQVLGKNKELVALRDQILQNNTGNGQTGSQEEIVARAVAEEMARQYGQGSVRNQTLAGAVYEELKEKGITLEGLEDSGRIVTLEMGEDASIPLFNTIFRSTQVPEGTPDEAGTTGDVGFPPFVTRQPGYVDARTRPIQVTDLFPKFRTAQQRIKYMEELDWANSARETGEGNLYPEATLRLRQRIDEVVKITNSIPVTQEQLDDEGQVRMYLNNRVPFMVRQHLDSQLINGTGASAAKGSEDPAVNTQLVGLLARKGGAANATAAIQTKALPRKGNNEGLAKPLNELLNAKTSVILTGRAMPDHYVVHPYFWEAIALQETASAGYYLGSPANDFQMRIWGLPVAQTDVLVYNHATGVGTIGILGDFGTYSAMGIRSDMQVQMGLINDDFLRDVMRIKASVRVALCVYRPSAFMELTVAAGNGGLL